MRRLASPVVLLAFFSFQPISFAASPRKIAIAGAPSLVARAEKFSARFREGRPGVEVVVRGGGSNYAVEALRAGDIDVALVSRNLSASERAGIVLETLGHDAIMVLTYPANPLRGLTLAQLRDIYLGRVENWRALGGENRGVVALTREPSSALRTIFLELLFGHSNGKEKAFVLRAEKDKVLRTIKRVAGAVGYGIVTVEEAQAEWVRVLEIDGVFPAPENVRSQRYPLARPHLVAGRGRADPLVREWMVGFARFYRDQAAEPKRP